MSAERNEKGHFLPGNKAAKGNKGGRPARKRDDAYQAMLWSVVTPAKWKEIVEVQVDIAMGRSFVRTETDGDKVTLRVLHPTAVDMTRSTRWLGEYLIGKPLERTEMTDKGQEQVFEVLELIYKARSADTETDTDTGELWGDDAIERGEDENL